MSRRLPEGARVAVVSLFSTGFALGCVSHTLTTADALSAERGGGVCSWGATATEELSWGGKRRRRWQVAQCLCGAGRWICDLMLTEVTVPSLRVDSAHGDVPASSSAQACVAGPLPLQTVPGQTWALLHHGNGIVRGGWGCMRSAEKIIIISITPAVVVINIYSQNKSNLLYWPSELYRS